MFFIENSYRTNRNSTYYSCYRKKYVWYVWRILSNRNIYLLTFKHFANTSVRTNKIIGYTVGWSENRAYTIWPFPTYGHADPPPSLASEVVETLWKVRSVLNKMRRIIKNSSIFIFRVIIENWGDDVTKMTLKWP